MSYSCMMYEGAASCVSLWLKVELCFNIKPLTYLHYSVPVVSAGTLHEILHRPLCHGRMYSCISAYMFLFLFHATNYLEKSPIKGVCEYEHLYVSVTALQRLTDGHKFMERNVKKLQFGHCGVHELMAQTHNGSTRVDIWLCATINPPSCSRCTFYPVFILTVLTSICVNRDIKIQQAPLTCDKEKHMSTSTWWSQYDPIFNWILKLNGTTEQNTWCSHGISFASLQVQEKYCRAVMLIWLCIYAINIARLNIPNVSYICTTGQLYHCLERFRLSC